MNFQVYRTMLFLTLLSIQLEKPSAHRLTNPEQSKGLRGLNSDNLVCRVMVFDIEFERTNDTDMISGKPQETFYECIPVPNEASKDQDVRYALSLTQQFIDSHAEELMHGDAYIAIPQGALTWTQGDDGKSDRRVIIPPDADIQLIPTPLTNTRSLGRRTSGTRSILIVRISTTDAVPILTKEELAERWFGIGGNISSVNLKSQMHACSFGKLVFNPIADDFIGGITNGVTEIFLNRTANGSTNVWLVDEATSVIRSRYGSPELFDHIVYVLPPGTISRGKTRWLAYAYINWYESVYNNEWAGSVSTQMHEIGHNINLHHSNEGALVYNDQTGYMGYSYNSQETPQMCFNGAKNWHLGWYENRAITIDPLNGAWEGSLVAFVDYDLTTEDEFVIINVGSLYIQYNRKKKFNHQTMERGDQVTIVRAYSRNGSISAVISNLLGSVATDMVNVSPFYRYPNFTGTAALIIEVCEQGVRGDVDYATMSIYIDDGTQQSTCASANPSTTPTEFPSIVPTSIPTMLPSVSMLPTTTITPSMSPSVSPSQQPSLSSVPSASPSTSPSSFPTLSPSLSPTEVPSVSPSVHPTSFPTQASDAPSVSPSASPSVSPTVQPSVSPTRNPFDSPSSYPSLFPTVEPSSFPTQASDVPSLNPSASPSLSPTASPSDVPSVFPSTSPTAHPSMVPSNFPTELPSIAPSVRPTDDTCENSRIETFFVDAVRGNRNCIWLARRPTWAAQLCVLGQDAYDVCPELCKKCSDNCTDAVSLEFWTNMNQGFRDCQWLSIRPGWRDKVCHEEHDAYHLCKDTCDSCTAFATSVPSESPSFSPSLIPSRTECDDSQSGTFYVERKGDRNCIWLARRPHLIPTLCVPGNDAYDVCEETCGKCSDSCNDEMGFLGEFWVNRLHGWKDCQWLSVRPGWRDQLCHEGHDAYEFCKETCDNCK